MIQTVIKRNGEKKPFDISKIRNQCEFSTEGTNLNPLELESKFSTALKNNISTKEIQELLGHTCASMVTPETPEWILPAGRIMMHQLHREVFKNTKIDYKDFVKYLDYAVSNGYYRKDIKNAYTEDELYTIEKRIIELHKTDFDKVLPQVLILKSKYLNKNKKGTIEYPLFADAANAMILASIEDKPVKDAKEYLELLAKEYISLATPFKANLRIPDGNTGSCFILDVSDSLSGISKSWSDAAKISQEGGGIGIYLGYLRPEGSYSKNVPKANNITKWVKIINDIAVAVNQRGIRPGAITPAIDWWHLDIESFMEVKTETGGDLREKSFDIFPQVVVDKYFVDKKKNNEDVYLFDHYELKELTGIVMQDLIDDELYQAHETVKELIEAGKLKHYKKVNTKEIWTEFLRVWVEIGDFYIAHKENINLSNYLKPKGYLAKSVNLCVESFSVTKAGENWKAECAKGKTRTTETDSLYHSCNLISINVGIINDDKLLKRVCTGAVKMLDASVDTGTMPVLEAENSAKMLRNVGIGIVGLADWMAWNKYTYEENLDEIEALQEKIAYYCYEASIELAKEKGAYEAFEPELYDNGLFGRSAETLNKESKNGFDWVKLINSIKENGIRNFLLLAIAPNTSSGIVMNSTASWLPPQNKVSYQTLAEINTPIVPRYLGKRWWYYKAKSNYKAEDMLKVVRRLQKWIDTGVSSEVYINPLLTNIKKISDEILDGFDKGELKAVYYSLTIDPKEKDKKSQKEAVCVDCAN